MSLAKSIRALERDTYDLAGSGGAGLSELLSSAFSTPLEASEPLRITLVVGGGKKVRGAYGETLMRDVCTALEKLGFSEDRGASASKECQGRYKHQHDTDKDLKFVHVFPHVDTTAAEAAAAAEAASRAAPESVPPEELVLLCAPEALEKHFPRRLASFAQKQALLKLLRAAAARCAACEAALAALTPLTDTDQAFYERAVALPEKIALLQAAMEAQVTAGGLTRVEQEGVLAQLKDKADEAQAAASAAVQEGKAVKADKLVALHASLVARRDAVSAIKAIAPAVKHEKELRALRAQLAELEKIEACRGLQPLETVRKLRDKPGVIEQIDAIYAANKGWFEDEEAFQKRMKAAGKPSSATAAKAPTGGGAPSSVFSAPKQAAARPKASAAKTGTSNVWAALGNE